MTEYQFRTTRTDSVNSGIFRLDQRPSGIVIPFSIAQISYDNTTDLVVPQGLHIPSRNEAAHYGIDISPAAGDTAPAIEQFSFSERSIEVFGRRALQTCVEIIQDVDATNVVIILNPNVEDEAEKDLMRSISHRIARHSAGLPPEEDKRDDPPTGMYL